MRNRDTTVFTNGCFDILHIGHVRYLKHAKALGDLLIIGINSDASVKRLKGEDRPINNQEHRAEMLMSLGCVDRVYIFDEDTPYQIIDRIRPDVLVKGLDYIDKPIAGQEIVSSYGGKVLVVGPFEKSVSTTEIIKKIRG